MTASEATARRVGRPAMDRATAERLRDEVIDAAARCFASKGVGATSIDDIAAEAGLSRASVYRHAGGRDELIVAVTMRRFDEWVDGVVRHARRSQTAGDIIGEAIVWTAKTVRRDESLASLFAGGTAMAASRVFDARSASSGGSSPTESWRRQFGALLEEHQGELRTGLDPFVVADRVLSVILERLARAAERNREISERSLRDWIDAWLLPAVLETPPPLPESAQRHPTTRDEKKRDES